MLKQPERKINQYDQNPEGSSIAHASRLPLTLLRIPVKYDFFDIFKR